LVRCKGKRKVLDYVDREELYPGLKVRFYPPKQAEEPFTKDIYAGTVVRLTKKMAWVEVVNDNGAIQEVLAPCDCLDYYIPELKYPFEGLKDIPGYKVQDCECCGLTYWSTDYGDRGNDIENNITNRTRRILNPPFARDGLD
jgi:hypothetical protein